MGEPAAVNTNSSSSAGSVASLLADKPAWLRSQSSVELDVTQLQRVASTPAASAANTPSPSQPVAQTGSVSEKSKVYWDLSRVDDDDDGSPTNADMGNQLKALSMSGVSGVGRKEDGSTGSAGSVSSGGSSSSNTFVGSATSSSTYHSMSLTKGAHGSVDMHTVNGGESSLDHGHGAVVHHTLSSRSSSRSEAHSYTANILSRNVHGKLYTNPHISSKDDVIKRHSKIMADLVNGLFEAAATEVDGGVAVIRQMRHEMARAWAMPVIGRDVATSMCNILLERGALKVIVSNLDSGDSVIKLSSAELLSQCLTTHIRTILAEEALEVVVDIAKESVRDLPLLRASLCILEHLLKVAENHCFRAIQLDALKPILHGCSQTDIPTLRHCAMTLANLALFGGPICQVEMARRHVSDWLFPLAFSTDSIVKYFAFFAICAMVSNGEVEAAVLRSGTLELVEPFLAAHNPLDFASCDESMSQGQSTPSLARAVPLLSSKRREPQSLASFHFAMEGAIKSLSRTQHVFTEIGAIEPLERLVCSSNSLASRFAAQALHLIGHSVPKKLSPQVYHWSVDDVNSWLRKRHFSEAVVTSFTRVRVDGDILLRLSDALLPEVGISNRVEQLRFLRELEKLRLSADYSSRDHSGVSDWLRAISHELYQYTYPMLNSSVTLDSLPLLTDNMLREECGIANCLHRAKILQALTNNPQALEESEKWYDAFISYRRSSGSQLASLLKVHLALRKYRVYLDIETLKGGKFAESMLNSIKRSHNFVLVLTHDALDRCVGDVECKDWVHREIVAALEGGCNIVPVLDQHAAMPPTDKLPDDIRQLSTFNGFTWVHEMQDACIDRLEDFLRLDPRSPQKQRRLTSVYSQTRSFEGCGSRSSRSSLHDVTY